MVQLKLRHDHCRHGPWTHYGHTPIKYNSQFQITRCRASSAFTSVFQQTEKSAPPLAVAIKGANRMYELGVDGDFHYFKVPYPWSLCPIFQLPLDLIHMARDILHSLATPLHFALLRVRITWTWIPIPAPIHRISVQSLGKVNCNLPAQNCQLSLWTRLPSSIILPTLLS